MDPMRHLFAWVCAVLALVIAWGLIVKPIVIWRRARRIRFERAARSIVRALFPRSRSMLVDLSGSGGSSKTTMRVDEVSQDVKIPRFTPRAHAWPLLAAAIALAHNAGDPGQPLALNEHAAGSDWFAIWIALAAVGGACVAWWIQITTTNGECKRDHVTPVPRRVVRVSIEHGGIRFWREIVVHDERMRLEDLNRLNESVVNGARDVLSSFGLLNVERTDAHGWSDGVERIVDGLEAQAEIGRIARGILEERGIGDPMTRIASDCERLAADLSIERERRIRAEDEARMLRAQNGPAPSGDLRLSISYRGDEYARPLELTKDVLHPGLLRHLFDETEADVVRYLQNRGLLTKASAALVNRDEGLIHKTAIDPARPMNPEVRP